MASKKNTDRKKPPAGESPAQRQTDQEQLVDGRRDGSFPIVGLGASAGGLETLSEFFERLSAMKRKVLATGAPGMSCVAVNVTFPP